MKIDWSDEALTEARVTRGWWKWKRSAIVKLTTDEETGTSTWRYRIHRGPEVDDETKAALRRERYWPRLTGTMNAGLPVARVV